MRFKEFLMLEHEIDDSGSDWFYGNSLYPSDAYDWKHDANEPISFALLQGRWKKERDEWGRKFYNIDVQDTLDKKFTSIYSNTMPSPDGGFWRHSDKERPNIEVDNDASMKVIGQGKTAKIAAVLYKCNPLLDKTEELNQIFGEFKPSFPELATNFDKPWSPYTGEVKMKKPKKKKYPKHINNF